MRWGGDLYLKGVSIVLERETGGSFRGIGREGGGRRFVLKGGFEVWGGDDV